MSRTDQTTTGSVQAEYSLANVKNILIVLFEINSYRFLMIKYKVFFIKF